MQNGNKNMSLKKYILQSYKEMRKRYSILEIPLTCKNDHALSTTIYFFFLLLYLLFAKLELKLLYLSLLLDYLVIRSNLFY